MLLRQMLFGIANVVSIANPVHTAVFRSQSSPCQIQQLKNNIQTMRMLLCLVKAGRVTAIKDYRCCGDLQAVVTGLKHGE